MSFFALVLEKVLPPRARLARRSPPLLCPSLAAAPHAVRLRLVARRRLRSTPPSLVRLSFAAAAPHEGMAHAPPAGARSSRSGASQGPASAEARSWAGSAHRAWFRVRFGVRTFSRRGGRSRARVPYAGYLSLVGVPGLCSPTVLTSVPLCEGREPCCRASLVHAPFSYSLFLTPASRL